MYKIMLFYQGNVVAFGGAVPIVITTRKMQIFLTLNLFMSRSTLPYPGTQEQYEVRMLRDTVLKLSFYVLTFLFSQVCLCDIKHYLMQKTKRYTGINLRLIIY